MAATSTSRSGTGRQATSSTTTRGELGLSALAYQFLGGIFDGADELCAIFNPTVNSYKRINAPRTLSGATWAPNAVSYSGNNRTHMVRIPDAGRLRAPPGSTVRPTPTCPGGRADAGPGRHAQPGATPARAWNQHVHRGAPLARRCERLPLNLLDAVRGFEASTSPRAGFGAELVASYAKLKHDEWHRYCNVVTDWERETTLDC